MTGDPELRALAAAFPLWRVHRLSDGSAFIAWRPGAGLSSHRRDTTLAGLRARIEAYEEGDHGDEQ